ncbi:glycosyltransferase [Alteribacter lacisalsi]|uniref:Glycosyltransferase n=1 Tax=Alteribacter lacisalsi TaxID=2045244 RepID=A0A2W0HH12_9BACI|nr:glycosyltransferase family 4 protein [Alteribacter lacisalsi]PYZ96715.1 glycosyltransferase [Alteribacter lacisalsi]
MDILYVVDNNVDTIGGEQESTKIILNEMKKQHHIGLVQPGKPPKKCRQIESFTLTGTPKLKQLVKKPWRFLGYINRMRKIIRGKRPELIHSHAQASFFIVALLKFLRLIPQSNVVVHTERGLYSKYGKPVKLLFYLFLKKADVLVTTTKHNRDMWKEGLEKFKYSRRLDFRVIENTAGELYEDQTAGHSGEKELHVGFAGRYAGWKNWPLAVDISQGLEERFPGKVKVSMAVGCHEQPCFEAVEAIFKDMNELLGSRFDGKINTPFEDMRRFYSDINYFVLTSDPDTESFGRTLVEAMASRTIVFTTNAGGSEEVVGKDDNVGRTAEDFVEKIARFYTDNAAAEQEKQRSVERAKQTYSTENNISKHIRLYEDKLMEKDVSKALAASDKRVVE